MGETTDQLDRRGQLKVIRDTGLYGAEELDVGNWLDTVSCVNWFIDKLTAGVVGNGMKMLELGNSLFLRLKKLGLVTWHRRLVRRLRGSRFGGWSWTWTLGVRSVRDW